jgi:hypothetical protein
LDIECNKSNIYCQYSKNHAINWIILNAINWI